MSELCCKGSGIIDCKGSGIIDCVSGPTSSQ